MERRPFSEILKEATVDIKVEYRRLYKLFYIEEHNVTYFDTCTIRKYVSLGFYKFNKIRGTCLYLDEFDRTHKFNFPEYPPRDFDVNYLLLFCEYSYNLVSASKTVKTRKITTLLRETMLEPINFYIQQVDKVIEKIGYIKNEKDSIVNFVPRSQTAISVAEIIDPELSYDVIEYNHHSMKGDVERKRRIIEALSQKYAAVELCLEKVDSKLVDDLGFMLNNLNIRHNNEDPTSHDYHYIFAKLDEDIIEKWYDETYQLLLLAFLKHDNIDRREKIKKLRIELKEMDKQNKKNKKLQKNES